MEETFSFERWAGELAAIRKSFFEGRAGELAVITNCFYSYKEIFLQVLLRNASNALDKIRLMSLTGKIKPEADLCIRLVLDREKKTLSIVDNGIGMTRQDSMRYFGRIWRYRSQQFMKALRDGADGSMIREFGLGFHSIFLVADNVRVTSKQDGEQQLHWEADDIYCFSACNDVEGNQVERGTIITLHLKQDQLEYLEEERIKCLVEKHSQYIGYPIYLQSQEEFELINRGKPIWTRKPEEITKEEYASFYKSLTNPWEEDYLAVKHFSVEGKLELKGILFVPKRPTFNFVGTNGKKMVGNTKLYARKLFVVNNFEVEFIPEYLSFVKGVVDWDIDLQPNIAVEMLKPYRYFEDMREHLVKKHTWMFQQNGNLKVIRESLVKKCIEMFNEIAEKEEDYNQFYEAFSNNLKLGIRDHAKLADLLRYYSTKSGDKMTSLKDYVSRMKEGQEGIYYIPGESKQALESSRLLGKFKEKGYEVLYMVDGNFDSYALSLKEYKGKKFVSVKKKARRLDVEEEKKKKAEKKKSLEKLCNVMKALLGEKVEKVEIGEYGGWSRPTEFVRPPTMSHLDIFTCHMCCKKVMVINPLDGQIEELRQRVAEADKNYDAFKGQVRTLFTSAIYTSMFRLSDPENCAARIQFSYPKIPI